MNMTASASATAIIDKEDVDNIRQYNVETEKQSTFFGDYNQQRKILNQQLQQQKSNQEALAKSLRGELGVMYETSQFYNKIKQQRIELEAEDAKTSKLNIQRKIELKTQIDALKKSEAELAEKLKATNTNFIEQSQKLAEVETALADTEKQIVKLGSG